MTETSSAAGLPIAAVHPSRLALFENIDSAQFEPIPRAAASSSTVNNVQQPVDSGANSVPVRATIRKRRVPVWTLPLKPLSKTARAKKKAEEKRKAKFYGGGFRSEAEKEKDRSRARKEALRKVEKPIKEHKRVKKSTSTTQSQLQAGPSGRTVAGSTAGIEDQTQTGEADTTQTRHTSDKEKDKSKKKSGSKKESKTNHKSKDKDRSGKRKHKKDKSKKRAKSSSRGARHINGETEMDGSAQSLVAGKSAQNAIALPSSSEPEPPVSPITIDEEEERIEYGPRPPRMANATAPTNISESEAGPSTPHLYHVQYPVGGTTWNNDGDGIFMDPKTEEGIRIWIDPTLRKIREMVTRIEEEYGMISAEHYDEETQIMILHPGTTYIFDMYCHPKWLKPHLRERYRLAQKEDGDNQELWQRKVLLKDWWVDECIKAGRFLGQADNWGGCRAGGPPSDIAISTGDTTVSPAAPEQQAEGESLVEEVEQPEDGMSMQQVEVLPQISDEMEVDEVVGEIEAVEDTIDSEVVHMRDPGQDNVQPVIVDDGISLEHLRQIPVNPRALPAHVSSDNYADSDATEIAPWASSQQVNQAGPSNYQDNMLDNIRDDVDMEEDEEEEEEPVDPAKMFAGLKFWVDISYPDRSKLLGRIKAAAGSIVATYDEATHVLIHNYKFPVWNSIVEGLTKQGIWSLNISWLPKSLDRGRKLPEEESAVLNGNPFIKEAEKAKKKTQHKQLDQNSGMYHQALLPSERLAEIFQKEMYMLGRGGTMAALAAFLANKYGVYSEKKWGQLYLQYIRQEERFAYLVPNSTVKVKKESIEQSTTATSSTSTAPPKKTKVEQSRISTEDLADIFTNEASNRGEMTNAQYATYLHSKDQQYPIYPSISWLKLISEWRHKKGRFDKFQDNDSRSTPVMTNAISDSSQVQLPENSTTRVDYSNEELERIFSASETKQAAEKSSKVLGKELASKYGCFHSVTWAVMYSEWERKSGRFKVSANGNTKDSAKVNRRESTTSVSTKPNIPSPTKSNSASLAAEAEDGPGAITIEERARIFKSREEEFVRSKLTSVEIGLVLMTEYGISARATWRKHWTHWWRRGGAYAHLPATLQSTVAAKAYEEEQLPFRGVKPSGQSTDPSRYKETSMSPTKRMKQSNTKKAASYTMQEEKEMAVYISEYNGENPSTIGAWMLFANTHPGRTASAYAQHYSTYQFRIDSYKPKKDGDTVLDIDIDDLAPPSGSQAKPFVIDDDDDEEEEEQLEPPIIVLDDDDKDQDYVEIISITDDDDDDDDNNNDLDDDHP
ncbi:uncharacterized protein L201_007793 [Kwoniella dendrophila CBS 6074]|uniref:BRCT domain-containing protein n=1 Tax=Kwoniella dendrophila CBS 6074 TaxID=1295534 RepID=A0AAX4K613_9TREE